MYQYPGASMPVVHGLSLTLPPGRVIALCGAARSGRSTVMALLAGLFAPGSGTVTVNNVAATALEARGMVGLLLQNADEALFGLTVREDVMFAPLQLGVTSEDAATRAERALRVAGLDPRQFARRSPFSLSGGQRRRAAIAGLLAMEPSYVLLDEPFVGLDPQGRDEIRDVIRSIAVSSLTTRTGVLVALSTLHGALELVDDLIVLHDGRAVWEGSVAAYAAEPPAVAPWGLRQPDLIALGARLREDGWRLPPAGVDAPALAGAIAAQLKGGRP